MAAYNCANRIQSVYVVPAVCGITAVNANAPRDEFVVARFGQHGSQRHVSRAEGACKMPFGQENSDQFGIPWRRDAPA